ncbi:MAG TPA: septation protein SepH [Marmoricola sp.]|nr:septation protein SepH [Marmoricola sp.]
MQELTPVGLSKDGKRLVLLSASGQEFSVTVDHRLRAALRGDNARLGQLEMKMESALRPRDIQARIRAGESPEQVAAAAQTTVEAIMGFATPVLAERAHVAQTAQKSSVRRRSAESSSSARTLGDAAATTLSDLGIAEDEVAWDSWRRDDGRWTLVADFGEHHAEFTYDQRGRYVSAENDHARLLTGEVHKPSPDAPASRRLSAVPDQDELPLGDDALALVRERPAEAPGVTTAPAVPEVPEAAGSEPVGEAPAARRQAPDPATGAEQEAAAPSTRSADESPAQSPTESAVESSTGSPAPSAARAGEPTGEPVAESTEESTGEPTAEPSGDPAEGEPRSRASRRKGRASVPSWDEIMFGGGRND